MVSAIQKVDLNAPGITVTLTGGDKGIEEGFVVCEFDNPTRETVKRIKLGQQIKVRGVCKGTGLKSMALVRVTLVEP
jgi:hypothetical protein